MKTCQIKRIIIFILLFYSVLHFIYSGIYYPINKPIGFRLWTTLSEQIYQLQESLLYNKRIEIKDARQYGPITFFVFHPVIKYELKYIVNYAYIIDLILSIGIIFLFIKISKIFIDNKEFNIIIVILVLNFLPFLMNLALSTVEICEIFLINLATYYFINI